MITTDSTTGSEDRAIVRFNDETGAEAGAIEIKFNSPIEYSIWWCSSSITPLLITPPEEVDKTWRIRYDQTTRTVKIWCNDVKVLDVTLSGVCGESSWREKWEKDTTKIQFPSDDTAFDKYSTPSNIVIGINI